MKKSAFQIPAGYEYFYQAFEAIPDSTLARSPKDKLALVVEQAMENLIEHHLSCVVANGGSEIHTYIDAESWSKFGLAHFPDDAIKTHPEVVTAVLNATWEYLQLVQTQPAFTDVFAEFHAIHFTNKGSTELGQFLTPPGLAEKIAGFLPPLKPKEDARGELSISDPTCGFGSLILGMLRHHLKELKSKGDEEAFPFSDWFIDARDIDPLCCAITVLQLYANRVLHGQPFKEILVVREDAIRRDGEVLFHNYLSVPFHLWDCQREKRRREKCA